MTPAVFGEKRILYSNLRLFKELEGFLTRFRGETPILLKGSGLVASDCRDMRERPMEDADILLRPKDIPEAIRTLESLGFQKMPGLLSSYRKEGLDIDLHDGVWYLDKSEEEEFRARSRPVAVGESRARVPHPLDHLIFIMAHAAVHHGVLEPKWLEDARVLSKVSASEINGARTAALAAGFGLGPAISWFLERSGLEIPGLNEALPGAARWRGLLESDFPYRGQLLTMIFLRDWPFRLRFAVKTLFPETSFMSRRYDLEKPGRSIFWRVVRPLQLVAGFMVSLGSLAARFLLRRRQS